MLVDNIEKNCTSIYKLLKGHPVRYNSIRFYERSNNLGSRLSPNVFPDIPDDIMILYNHVSSVYLQNTHYRIFLN